MEIVFALLVLTLIILGLRNRKKEKKEWVREERYEESGDWIDKRSGERGNYGSLDDEMEANRQYIAKRNKISVLAQNMQRICFEQHPAYAALSQAQLKQHLDRCKLAIAGLFEQADGLLGGKTVQIASSTWAPEDLRSTLKKQILDFSFEHFPKLLDLEIEQIKQYDQAAENLAQKVLDDIGLVQG